LWSASRIDLVEGNSDLLIPKESDISILDAFVVLDVHSNQMLSGIKSLLEPVSGVPRVLTDIGVVEELLGLAEQSMEFLTRMDLITEDYQTISDDRISFLLLVELILLGFTAIILSVEIMFMVFVRR
jgi:two-component system sensor histidine kinase DegS